MKVRFFCTLEGNVAAPCGHIYKFQCQVFRSCCVPKTVKIGWYFTAIFKRKWGVFWPQRDNLEQVVISDLIVPFPCPSKSPIT